MNVAQVMAGAAAGGAELFYERLTIALHRAGETVLPVFRHNEQRALKLALAGLNPAQLRFGGPLDLTTGRRLGRLLRRFGPHVVLAWMNRAARFTPRGEWVLIGRMGGYYNLSYYRRCDHLVGNTIGIVNWVARQGWPCKRVHYLPNFAEDFGNCAPATLPVPQGVPIILGLGRLHPNKGFDLLIRALRHLRAAHAVIAGEGPERPRLEAIARAAGVADRMHLPGWRRDTGALLAAADVLVCPSRHEPLGNVVIEAWSARRPVVATRAQGPSELIHDGVDGLLVPLEDAKALADGIAGLLSNSPSARALAAAGRARFEAEFAEAPVVARWRNFLGCVERP
jgi:glycosyltransferase involved in cell wall biosynthesis